MRDVLQARRIVDRGGDARRAWIEKDILAGETGSTQLGRLEQEPGIEVVERRIIRLYTQGMRVLIIRLVFRHTIRGRYGSKAIVPARRSGNTQLQVVEHRQVQITGKIVRVEVTQLGAATGGEVLRGLLADDVDQA